MGLAISRDISYIKFAAIASSIITHAEQSGIALADASGEKLGAWEVSNETVRLNGYGADSHETFEVSRDSSIYGIHFCKTNEKPYDVVVTALLIALTDAYGDSADVKSDGYPEEWAKGLELFESATGLVGAVPPGV
jgi:hypothetical protein